MFNNQTREEMQFNAKAYAPGLGEALIQLWEGSKVTGQRTFTDNFTEDMPVMITVDHVFSRRNNIYVQFDFASKGFEGEFVVNLRTHELQVHLQCFDKSTDLEPRHTFYTTQNDYMPTKWVGDYALKHDPKYQDVLDSWYEELPAAM